MKPRVPTRAGSGFLAAMAALAIFMAGTAQAQLSQPVVTDKAVDAGGNKFLQRKGQPAKTEASVRDEEPLPSESCSADLDLIWMTELSSSIYAPPLVHDLHSDGRKEILVSTFARDVAVLEASSGSFAGGMWPARDHHGQLRASPLAIDCDQDGVLDVMVVTYEGEIACYDENGHKILDMNIPPLRVNKDWFVGLDPDHVDHSHPDVQDGDDEAELKESNAKLIGDGLRGGSDTGSAGGSRLLLEETVGPASAPNQEKALSQEAQDSFGIFRDEEEAHDEDEDGGSSGSANANSLYDEEYEDYGAPFHDGAWDEEEDWDDVQEDWSHRQHHEGEFLSEGKLSVDAHVLCTPAVMDVDGDGRDDVVLAVTYFFEGMEAMEDLHAVGVDASNYLAGGVVVVDLASRTVKWSQHLDLSTFKTQFQARMLSTPTVADINGDGRLEVVVGTSVGFVYVLDAVTGNSLPNWPIQMGEVQAQVIVEDIDGDGAVEVVASDMRGNVAAFNAEGREKWELHMGTTIAQHATVGDVDGDGALEVVFGGGDGSVFVLDGVKGEMKGAFKTNAAVMAPVLLAKLVEDSSKAMGDLDAEDPEASNSSGRSGLHMVVMSHDGFLYAIDGKSGCADVVDIGEKSYSMVLYDDLDGDGKMELLVSTMNGNMYSFKAFRSRYHPRRSWPSTIQAANGAASRESGESAFFLSESRAPRDVTGKTLPVTFRIVDDPMSDRAKGNEVRPRLGGLHAPYNVTVKLKGVGIDEMNAGDNPVVGAKHAFAAPGVYTAVIPCPRSRTTGLVEICMTDINGKTFVDSFVVSFHMSSYRILKWLLALPMVLGSLL